MAHSFDVSLKSLFQDAHGIVSKLLFGGPVVEWLDAEQPKVTNRRGDVLAKTSDGRLHHVEFQTRNDPEMPFRMLEYYVGYRRRWRDHIEQVLLYAGKEPLRMKDVFQSPTTRHAYRIVNVRELDGEPLLLSSDWRDNALALLTGADRERVIQFALTRLSKLKGQQRTNAKATFVLISGIIGIEDEIRRRLDIGMTIDLMQNKVFRPILEEAMEEGGRKAMVSTLCTLLEKRFGKLAPRARKQIRNADRATLERWIVRVGDAPSVSEVFQ